MKIAMIHWMREEPLATTVERLSRCGYDGLEINGSPERYEAAEVRELLDRHGIALWGAVTLMEHGGRDMLHPDPYVRQGTQAYLEDTVDLISGSGGEVLCCVPSTIGKVAPLAEEESEWRWAVEGLQRLGAYAGERGVRIALEPITRFETYFLNRCEQALRLADDVGLPNVGICLDTYHMNMEEPDLLEAVRFAGDRLFDFHVADSDRMPAGMGSLDWREILATLDEVGYEGSLTVEVEPPRDRTPLARVPVIDGEFEANYYEEVVRQTATHLRSLTPEREAETVPVRDR
jgi:D-psicose/D-tagatose/L-ribulose 3-epimerase